MVFEINGVNGKYNNVSDSSERYGLNAANNHKKLVASAIESGIVNGEPPILDFMPTKEAIDYNIKQLHGYIKKNDNDLNSLPPIEYEYRYMPEVKDGKIDKKALFGAAREEMGAELISVKEFDKKIFPNDDYSAEVLDLNKDGYIDIPEYSASLLAADILSKANPATNKVNGVINARGMDIVYEYSRKSKAEAAAKMYSKIYDTYKLNELA